MHVVFLYYCEEFPKALDLSLVDLNLYRNEDIFDIHVEQSGAFVYC